MSQDTTRPAKDPTDLVGFKIDGPVAWIELNDPPTRNALSIGMAKVLIARLEQAEREARAVVLTGAPGAFCSGANLQPTPDRAKDVRDLGKPLVEVLNPVMLKLRNLSVPLLVAVNGAAAGIGCSLALSGDIIVASDEAFFLQAFSRIGLVPDGGAAYLVARAAGRVRAMEMAMLDEKLNARQALEWGLVTRVVPADTLAETVGEIAQRLANGPTLAYAEIRRLVWGACETDFEAQLAREAQVQTQLGRSPDHAEGVQAFLERRRPAFTGKPAE